MAFYASQARERLQRSRAARATGPVQRAGSMLWSLLRCPLLNR
ncbi:MAG: hypothetical protein ACRDQI_10810 [Pseudonocardiaceae bacterium]